MYHIRMTKTVGGRRDHWAVNPSRSGWCIQRAHADEAGHHYDMPLPEHTHFDTKKEAQAVARQLRSVRPSWLKGVESS